MLHTHNSISLCLFVAQCVSVYGLCLTTQQCYFSRWNSKNFIGAWRVCYEIDSLLQCISSVLFLRCGGAHTQALLSLPRSRRHWIRLTRSCDAFVRLVVLSSRYSCAILPAAGQSRSHDDHELVGFVPNLLTSEFRTVQAIEWQCFGI